MRIRLNFAGLVTALFSVLLLLAGCGKDNSTGVTTCEFDVDCPLGKVCQEQDKICIEAACDFCTAEQICYKPTPDAPGTCSAPECSSNDECTDGQTCRGGVCSDGGCVTNDDCGEAEVCNLAGQCVESDGTCGGDADCPTGQVCKDDSCVAGCSNDDECEEGEYCNADEKACLDGCRDSMECPTGQVCTDGDCSCDATSCADGKVCLDTGNCGDPTSCDQVDCGTQVCDPATLSCIDACVAGGCMPNEVCNMQSGLCEVNNCPGEDPNQCDPQSTAPMWDPIKCICAACITDNDCDMAAGEVCNGAGQCFACETACDASSPGTCGNAANGTEGSPYCINDCCVECVGAADCADGEFCLDGFCGQPPNCQVDPTVCPTGYECNQATGQCDPPTTGQNCDPTDPSSCPMGTFCDPMSMTCGGGGGGLGCGLCNEDCTCDGPFTCNGFYCTSDDPADCLDCADPVTCAITFLVGLNVCLP